MAHTFTKSDVRWWFVRIFYFVCLTLTFVGSCLGGSSPSILCPEACSCLSSVVDCRPPTNQLRLRTLPENLPTWVTDLELQSNKITHLESDAFAHLYHLERLDLSNNKLKNISENAFRGLGRLKELKLYRNKLQSFPRLGADLVNLTHVILHHNRISSVTSEHLANLPSLRFLDLSFNKLSSLPVNLLPVNSPLHQLELENNQIAALPSNAFANAADLQVLILARNRIANLEARMFAGLSGLRHLDLDHNQLNIINGLTFKHLESLETLSIRSNGITEIKDGAFYINEGVISHLDLGRNHIPSVSQDWMYGLRNLQDLNLDHNLINETDSEGWPFTNALARLNLSHNHLESLAEGGFHQLGNLEILDLGHNRIEDMAGRAFIGLTSLIELDLSFNQISWRGQDMTRAFEGLDSIHTLDLSENAITYLPHGAFTGLENVRKMYLRGNEITTMAENPFEELSRLNELHLNTSSMFCNCKVSWFPEWVRDSGFLIDIAAICAHPENLEGRNMFELSKSQMNCRARPEPYILTEPKGVAALNGDNITLLCEAASSSDAPLTVSWRKDGKNLQDPDVLNYETRHDGVKKLTSAIRLLSIKDENEGRYTCHFENEFGVVHSRKAKVTVHVFPTFVKKPVNINVNVGESAKLECSAKGQPTPEVAWKKDGGDNFPAAIERRFRVYKDSDTFFITPVKKVDMGVYTCTAENSAGIIMANVTLTVLEAPNFVEPLKPLQVGIGESAVLECHVSGSPPPVVSWLKDGQPFKTSNEHRLMNTKDTHLLIIMSMKVEDEGTYTCRANNSEGFTQQTTTLNAVKDGGLPLIDATTTGVIIICIVFCIVGTSLIWVIIIYKTRKLRKRYTIPHSEEPSLPAEIPSTSLNGSSEGTIHQETSSGVSSSATDKYQAENMSDCDSMDDIRRGDALGLPHHLRTAAIFPSEMDMEDRPEYGICLQRFPDHGIPEEEEVYKQLQPALSHPQHYPVNPEEHPFLGCHDRCFSDNEDIPLSLRKANTVGCVGETDPLKSNSDACSRFDERSFLSVNAYPYMPSLTRYTGDIASDDEQKSIQKSKKSRFPFSMKKSQKKFSNSATKRPPMPFEHPSTKNFHALQKDKMQFTKCPPHRKMDAGRRIELKRPGYKPSSSTSQLPTTELFANKDLRVPDIPAYHSLQKLSTSTDV